MSLLSTLALLPSPFSLLPSPHHPHNQTLLQPFVKTQAHIDIPFSLVLSLFGTLSP